MSIKCNPAYLLQLELEEKLMLEEAGLSQLDEAEKKRLTEVGSSRLEEEEQKKFEATDLPQLEKDKQKKRSEALAALRKHYLAKVPELVGNLYEDLLTQSRENLPILRNDILKNNAALFNVVKAIHKKCQFYISETKIDLSSLKSKKSTIDAIVKKLSTPLPAKKVLETASVATPTSSTTMRSSSRSPPPTAAAQHEEPVRMVNPLVLPIPPVAVDFPVDTDTKRSSAASFITIQDGGRKRKGDALPDADTDTQAAHLNKRVRTGDLPSPPSVTELMPHIVATTPATTETKFLPTEDTPTPHVALLPAITDVDTHAAPLTKKARTGSLPAATGVDESTPNFVVSASAIATSKSATRWLPVEAARLPHDAINGGRKRKRGDDDVTPSPVTAHPPTPTVTTLRATVKIRKQKAESKDEVVPSFDAEELKRKFVAEIQDSKRLKKWQMLLTKLELTKFTPVKGDKKFVVRKFSNAKEKDNYIGKYLRHEKSGLSCFEILKGIIKWKYPGVSSSVIKLDAKLVNLLKDFDKELNPKKSKKGKKTKKSVQFDFSNIPEDIKKDIDAKVAAEFDYVVSNDEIERATDFLKRLDIMNWETHNSFIGKSEYIDGETASEFKANNFTQKDCYGTQLYRRFGIERTFVSLTMGGKTFLVGAYDKDPLVSVSAPQSQIIAYQFFKLNQKFYPEDVPDNTADHSDNKTVSPSEAVPSPQETAVISPAEKDIQRAFSNMPEAEQKQLKIVLAEREKLVVEQVSLNATGSKKAYGFKFTSPEAAKAAKEKLFFKGKRAESFPNFSKIAKLFHFETKENYLLINLKEDGPYYSESSTKKGLQAFNAVEMLWKYGESSIPKTTQLTITTAEAAELQKDALEIINTLTEEDKVILRSSLVRILGFEWSKDLVHGWSCGFTTADARNTMFNLNFREDATHPSTFHLKHLPALTAILNVERKPKIHKTHKFGLCFGLKNGGESPEKSTSKAIYLMQQLIANVDQDLVNAAILTTTESKSSAESNKIADDMRRHNLAAIVAKKDINIHEIADDIDDKAHGPISLLELAVRQVCHPSTSSVNHHVVDLAILASLLARNSIENVEVDRLIKIAATNITVVNLLQAQKKTPTIPKSADLADEKRGTERKEVAQFGGGSIAKTVDKKIRAEIEGKYTKKFSELSKHAKPSKHELYKLQKCLLPASQACHSPDKGWHYEFVSQKAQRKFCKQVENINKHKWLKDTFVVQQVQGTRVDTGEPYWYVALTLKEESAVTDKMIAAENAVNHLLILQGMAKDYNQIIPRSQLIQFLNDSFAKIHPEIEEALSHLSSEDITKLYKLLLKLCEQEWTTTAEGLYTIRYEAGLKDFLKEFFSENAPDDDNHINLFYILGDIFKLKPAKEDGNDFIICCDWNKVDANTVTEKQASQRAAYSLQRLLLRIPPALAAAQKREQIPPAVQAHAFYEKMATGKLASIAADLRGVVNFASCTVSISKLNGPQLADIVPEKLSLLGFAVYNVCMSKDKLIAMAILEMLLVNSDFKATINQEVNGLTPLDIAMLNSSDTELPNKLVAHGALSASAVNTVERTVDMEDAESLGDEKRTSTFAKPLAAAAAAPEKLTPVVTPVMVPHSSAGMTDLAVDIAIPAGLSPAVPAAAAPPSVTSLSSLPAALPAARSKITSPSALLSGTALLAGTMGAFGSRATAADQTRAVLQITNASTTKVADDTSIKSNIGCR